MSVLPGCSHTGIAESTLEDVNACQQAQVVLHVNSPVHAMKAHEVAEVQLHSFLTSELNRGEWLDYRLGRFTAEERGPSTHWTRDWMDGLEPVEKTEMPCSCQ
jgi:hypothetical protein